MEANARSTAAARPFRRTAGAIARVAVACAALAGVAAAQMRSDEVPRQYEGVGVEQKLGERVPLDLAFTDADGKSVRIGDFFRDGRPVVLTLNYSDCPQLCVLQLEELATKLGDLSWTAGTDFQVVTVSIDPTETPAKARRKRELYVAQYGRDGVDGGWQFLVGEQASIAALADAVGFGYRFDPVSGEFAHDAVLIVLTPEGVVSRYVFGLQYDPVALRLSLADASEGELGGLAESFMGVCFQYDPASGSYVLVARNVMAIGGAVAALALVSLLIFLARYRPGGGTGAPPNVGSARRGAQRVAETAQAIP